MAEASSENPESPDPEVPESEDSQPAGAARRPAKDDPSLGVRAEQESPVVHRLEVEIDAARVQRAYDRAYGELARRVAVRGFRPGKAPRSVLQRLYGASLAEQIEQTLVSETLAEALHRADLAPVTTPAIEAAPPAEGAAFRYSARVEVRPHVELPDVEGLPARRPPTEVNEVEVEAELETLRQRSAPELEEPEGTRVAEGHVLSIDFVGRVGGQPFEGGSGRDVRLDVGSGRFLPGFEEQLLGAAAREDREVRVTFPADYGRAELAGQEAVFAVHVGAIKRRVVPELDDEFAKDLGDFDTLEDLRSRIRDDLRAARERAARDELRRTLMDALIERTRFEVPVGLVERELEQQLHTARHRLEGSVPAEALDAQLERWKEEWRPRAEREVRESLLLDAVARAEQIAVEPAEIDARIAEMAREQGMRPKALRKAYGEAALARAMEAQLRDEKALEFLVSRAKVEETAET